MEDDPELPAEFQNEVLQQPSPEPAQSSTPVLEPKPEKEKKRNPWQGRVKDNASSVGRYAPTENSSRCAPSRQSAARSTSRRRQDFYQKSDQRRPTPPRGTSTPLPPAAFPTGGAQAAQTRTGMPQQQGFQQQLPHGTQQPPPQVPQTAQQPQQQQLPPAAQDPQQQGFQQQLPQGAQQPPPQVPQTAQQPQQQQLLPGAQETQQQGFQQQLPQGAQQPPQQVPQAAHQPQQQGFQQQLPQAAQQPAQQPQQQGFQQQLPQAAQQLQHQGLQQLPQAAQQPPQQWPQAAAQQQANNRARPVCGLFAFRREDPHEGTNRRIPPRTPPDGQGRSRTRPHHQGQEALRSCATESCRRSRLFFSFPYALTVQICLLKPRLVRAAVVPKRRPSMLCRPEPGRVMEFAADQGPQGWCPSFEINRGRLS
eukprot:s1359_g5.t1